MIVIIMGVSGSGKTTVGRALAARLNWDYLDADDYHPATNVEKMASGHPLTDADRWPWLDRIVVALRKYAERGASVILGCSALKQSYRNRLTFSTDVSWVYLKGTRAIIAPRLKARHGHYMPAELLESQFMALEEPKAAIEVDIAQDVEDQVTDIIEALHLAA